MDGPLPTETMMSKKTKDEGPFPYSDAAVAFGITTPYGRDLTNSELVACAQDVFEMEEARMLARFAALRTLRKARNPTDFIVQAMDLAMENVCRRHARMKEMNKK